MLLGETSYTIKLCLNEAHLCSCLMMSSNSLKFLLRTSSEILVIITGFFCSRCTILEERGRRGTTDT